MENGENKISLAIYGIVLICFLLPFVNVSCEGQKVVSFTGIQLITGTTIEYSDSGIFGETSSQKTSGEPLAILAFISGIGGLILSFLKFKKSRQASAVAGGLGLIMLALLNSKLENDILKEGGGILQIEYGLGFYLAFILFVSAIGVNIYFLVKPRRFSPALEKAKDQHKFCTQCGKQNKLKNEYCLNCGKKF